MLHQVGGDDYKTMILNVIKKTMVKSVALQYSVYGKKGKKVFSSLRLYDAVTSKSLLFMVEVESQLLFSVPLS